MRTKGSAGCVLVVLCETGRNQTLPLVWHCLNPSTTTNQEAFCLTPSTRFPQGFTGYQPYPWFMGAACSRRHLTVRCHLPLVPLSAPSPGQGKRLLRRLQLAVRQVLVVLKRRRDWAAEGQALQCPRIQSLVEGLVRTKGRLHRVKRLRSQ